MPPTAGRWPRRLSSSWPHPLPPATCCAAWPAGPMPGAGCCRIWAIRWARVLPARPPAQMPLLMPLLMPLWMPVLIPRWIGCCCACTPTGQRWPAHAWPAWQPPCTLPLTPTPPPGPGCGCAGGHRCWPALAMGRCRRSCWRWRWTTWPIKPTPPPHACGRPGALAATGSSLLPGRWPWRWTGAGLRRVCTAHQQGPAARQINRACAEPMTCWSACCSPGLMHPADGRCGAAWPVCWASSRRHCGAQRAALRPTPRPMPLRSQLWSMRRATRACWPPK